mmetsp:Transcript_15805/g.23822  ORF Transcript_15805/g.23822 Transcript_15805/m.23822 type:complete len:478 (-) Transcript_15805:89-1522(-)
MPVVSVGAHARRFNKNRISVTSEDGGSMDRGSIEHPMGEIEEELEKSNSKMSIEIKRLNRERAENVIKIMAEISESRAKNPQVKFPKQTLCERISRRVLAPVHLFLYIPVTIIYILSSMVLSIFQYSSSEMWKEFCQPVVDFRSEISEAEGCKRFLLCTIFFTFYFPCLLCGYIAFSVFFVLCYAMVMGIDLFWLLARSALPYENQQLLGAMDSYLPSNLLHNSLAKGSKYTVWAGWLFLGVQETGLLESSALYTAIKRKDLETAREILRLAGSHLTLYRSIKEMGAIHLKSTTTETTKLIAGWKYKYFRKEQKNTKEVCSYLITIVHPIGLLNLFKFWEVNGFPVQHTEQVTESEQRIGIQAGSKVERVRSGKSLHMLAPQRLNSSTTTNTELKQDTFVESKPESIRRKIILPTFSPGERRKKPMTPPKKTRGRESVRFSPNASAGESKRSSQRKWRPSKGSRSASFSSERKVLTL